MPAPPSGSPGDQEVDVHIALFAAAEPEIAASAHMSPVQFGLSAFGILVALLVLTFAFRNAGHRH